LGTTAGDFVYCEKCVAIELKPHNLVFAYICMCVCVCVCVCVYVCVCIYIHTHTGWFRRNLHYFGKW